MLVINVSDDSSSMFLSLPFGDFPFAVNFVDCHRSSFVICSSLLLMLVEFASLTLSSPLDDRREILGWNVLVYQRLYEPVPTELRCHLSRMGLDAVVF
jgi:hypothetical protein